MPIQIQYCKHMRCITKDILDIAAAKANNDTFRIGKKVKNQILLTNKLKFVSFKYIGFVT